MSPKRFEQVFGIKAKQYLFKWGSFLIFAFAAIGVCTTIIGLFQLHTDVYVASAGLTIIVLIFILLAQNIILLIRIVTIKPAKDYLIQIRYMIEDVAKVQREQYKYGREYDNKGGHEKEEKDSNTPLLVQAPQTDDSYYADLNKRKQHLSLDEIEKEIKKTEKKGFLRSYELLVKQKEIVEEKINSKSWDIQEIGEGEDFFTLSQDNNGADIVTWDLE